MKQIKERTSHLPLDSGYAVDYFVARRDDLADILSGFPPFIIGAWRWDNTLLAHVYRDSKYTVIDGTGGIVALHQNTPREKNHEQRRGAQLNDDLARAYSGEDFWFGSIAFADVILIEDTHGNILEPQGKFQALVRKAYVETLKRS